MTGFLLYTGRSGLYLGIFYAFYLLVMRRTKFFRLNRAILLAGSLACALLPFLRIRTGAAATGAGPLTIAGAEGVPVEAAGTTAFPWPLLLQILYGIGVLAVIASTAISTAKMFRLIKVGEKKRLDGYRTVVLKGDHPSFSVGKTIVIGEKDLEENPAILTHERMHVKCRHYLDLFAFRLIQTVWWWNPLVWIMRTELGLLHEYEADEAVLNAGVEAGQYQMLLVRKAVGDERFSLASGFRYSKLKSRITMMRKAATPHWRRWSYLALIPFIAAAAYACNPAKLQLQEESVPPISYQLVEIKPSFNGSDINAFSLWVNKHLNYPESALSAGIQGRVIMGFTVDTDGRMKDISILRGVNADLDAEALRVVTSCKEVWTAGMQDGKPVKVIFTFPIIFQIR